jgi:uncharacterized DUF497 family protein
MIEFDEDKRAINIAKHGIDFVIAEDFDWSTAVIGEDDRYAYGETRLVAVGRVGGEVYTLVFTMRGDVVRVISMRLANRKERKLI